jgi:hypothetical protein
VKGYYFTAWRKSGTLYHEQEVLGEISENLRSQV